MKCVVSYKVVDCVVEGRQATREAEEDPQKKGLAFLAEKYYYTHFFVLPLCVTPAKSKVFHDAQNLLALSHRNKTELFQIFHFSQTPPLAKHLPPFSLCALLSFTAFYPENENETD